MRRAIGVLVALGGAAALAALSGTPYTAEPAQHALVRLAWRTRGERVQRCRRPTAEELARLPVHMRQEEICERGGLPYRLRAALDGQVVVDETVRAGGALGDRPLFVFHDLPVTPGLHRVAITFAPASAVAGAAPLVLDDTVRVAPRGIVLVTYDDQRRALRLLAAPAEGP